MFSDGDGRAGLTCREYFILWILPSYPVNLWHQYFIYFWVKNQINFIPRQHYVLQIVGQSLQKLQIGAACCMMEEGPDWTRVMPRAWCRLPLRFFHHSSHHHQNDQLMPG